MMRMNAASSPPLGLVAPFLLLSPLGFLAAGLLLATAGQDSLVGINVPRNVAATHAAIIGGLTTGIMGAIYQLGPAVLGGRLLSFRLARIQLIVHAISVPSFVWALLEWNVVAMGYAAGGVVLSFILFLVNAVPAVAAFRPSTPQRAYLSASLGMVAVTAGFGITWVGTLEHLWFPVTMGRLSGHAHMGMLGWLGLTVMGVSYQLVPMFNVVQRSQPRFMWPVLGLTVVSALLGGLLLMTDPSPAVRVAIAVAMIAGPTLWAVDMLRLLLARSRRTLDVQGRATFVSLGFLAVAMLLGVVSAVGGPLQDGDHAARWQLAYGFAGIGGWAGITFVGNSYKILPFLVWYHRYRFLAGSGPVPMVTDIYNERLARVVLALFAAAFVVMVGGAALATLPLLQAGAGLLAVAATAHFATLAHVVFAPHAATRRASSTGKVATR